MVGIGVPAVTASLVFGALTAAVFSAVSADAAVRQCTPQPIVAVGEDAASEAAARKLALERWVADAAKLGAQWTSWRLAVSRDLSCAKRADGGFACRVVGSPCAIAQNPDKLPKIDPGTKPPKPQQTI